MVHASVKMHFPLNGSYQMYANMIASSDKKIYMIGSTKLVNFLFIGGLQDAYHLWTFMFFLDVARWVAGIGVVNT